MNVAEGVVVGVVEEAVAGPEEVGGASPALFK